jgi:thioredoxin 1
VDTNPSITAQSKVRNIPTVIYIKAGEVVQKFVGYQQEKVFSDELEKLL